MPYNLKIKMWAMGNVPVGSFGQWITL